MTIFIRPFNATQHVDFVIDDDGTEIRAIATGPTGNGNPGNVETRVYKKQNRRGPEDQ